MEISNIASRQVNFKSQTQTQTSPIKTIKNKIENLEDNEKIIIGLSALGVIALATIAIMKKPHKTGEIIENVTNDKPAQEIAQQINEIAEEVKPKVKVGHLTKEEKLRQSVQQGAERAVEATQEYAEGGNYGKIKDKATKNLSHKGKKIVKEKLQEAHSAKVAQDIANAHNLSNATVQATQNADIAKNARQGLQNVTDNKKLEESVDTALKAVQDAEQKAAEARELAKEVGTKKAHKGAFRADKAAEKTKIEAEKTADRATRQEAKIKAEMAKKEANREAQKASPNYEDGLIKQMLNEDKGAKTRLKNLIKRKTQHGKMSEKQALEAIINDTKESKQVIDLAKEKLASL